MGSESLSNVDVKVSFKADNSFVSDSVSFGFSTAGGVAGGSTCGCTFTGWTGLAGAIGSVIGLPSVNKPFGASDNEPDLFLMMTSSAIGLPKVS